MKDIIIIGAGGHAKVIIDCIENENKYNVACIVDDSTKTQKILGYAVFPRDSASKYDGEYMIIAIGNPLIRKKIAQNLQATFITTIHPKAIVSAYAKVGAGSQIFASAVVNPDVVIGEHCIINTAAIVEHDCEIADYVHLSPNCSLAGGVTVGEGTHIGIGATIIQGVHIGKNVIIGAGAVVVSDIPDNCTAVGIPAKPIKFHSEY